MNTEISEIADIVEATENFNKKAFIQKAEELSKSPCLVVITQIDPDALACAFALRHLLHKLTNSIFIRICYFGSFSHPQNRCIMNRYDLMTDMIHVNEVQDFADHKILLVDSSKKEDERFPHLLEAHMVIDHHRGADSFEESAFVYIEDVGACSTFFVEMGETLKIKYPTKIKTLLALGIYTDTKGIIGGSARDTEAYTKISSGLNPADLRQFIDYPLPHSHFNNLQKALSNVKQQKNVIVTSCGIIQEGDGDDLSTIADYLMRMSGATMVCVWGIIGKKVRISVRNQDLTTPLDDFLKKRFGPKSGAKLTPDGKGEGGAMFEEGLGFWLTSDTEKEVLEMVARKIETEILRHFVTES